MSSLSSWLEGVLTPLVKTAVDEAVADLHDEIKADMTDMENRIVSQITQLPGLVASQVGHMALDAEQVAQQVAEKFSTFLNPGTLAQQIIQGVIGGLPHLPNIFGARSVEPVEPGAFSKSAEKLAGHETTSGTAQPPSKADQIRQKMQEKKGKK